MTAPPPAPHGYGQQPVSPNDERTWAILVHLSAFVVSILGPLVVYLVFRERSAWIRHHAVEALNFQLTVLIAVVVSIPLLFVLVGIVTLLATSILGVVFPVLAAVAASRNEPYRYPLTIRFVR